MGLNTEKIAYIDEQIRKWQEVRRIASDPEMLPILESLFSKNGATSITPSPTKRISSNGGRRGNILNASRTAIAKLPEQFKAPDVVQEMEAARYKFAAKDHLVAVNAALRRLIKEGEIRVAVQGSGRAPNIYERINRS